MFEICFVCSLDYAHRHHRFLNSMLEIVAVYLFMCGMGIFFVIMIDLAAAEVDDEDHLGPLTIFIPPKEQTIDRKADACRGTLG